MIIDKNTKAFQTINTHPNSNWTSAPDEELYIIDDASALAQRVMEYYPNFDFVLDADGNLTDVVQTEAEAITQSETSPITQMQLALAELAEAEAAHDLENKLALAELAEAQAGG